MHRTKMLLNKWSLLLYLCASCFFYTGCSNANEVKKEAQLKEIKTFLDAVPSDSSFVLWSNGPMSPNLSKLILRMLAVFDRLGERYLGNIKDVAAGKLIHHISQGLSDKIYGNGTVARFNKLEEIGLTLNPNVIIYEVSNKFVLRVELEDPEKFKKFLEPVEKELSSNLEQGKSDWIEWHKLRNIKALKEFIDSDENYDLIYAVVGRELVVTLLPVSQRKTESRALTRIYGLDETSKGSEVKTHLSRAAESLSANSFVGYLNTGKSENTYTYKIGSAFQKIITPIGYSSESSEEEASCYGRTIVQKAYTKKYQPFGIHVENGRVSFKSETFVSPEIFEVFKSNITNSSEKVSKLVSLSDGIVGVSLNLRAFSFVIDAFDAIKKISSEARYECTGEKVDDLQLPLGSLRYIQGLLDSITNISIVLGIDKTAPLSDDFPLQLNYLVNKFDDLSTLMATLKVASFALSEYSSYIDLIAMDQKITPLPPGIRSNLPSFLQNTYLYSDSNGIVWGTQNHIEQGIQLLDNQKIQRPLPFFQFTIDPLNILERILINENVKEEVGSSLYETLNRLLTLNLNKDMGLITFEVSAENEAIKTSLMLDYRFGELLVEFILPFLEKMR